jgi:hypothetical protein
MAGVRKGIPMNGRDSSDAHIPEAQEWSNRTKGSGKLFWFMVVSGLVLVVIGAWVVVGEEGDSRLVGISVLAFGAMCLVASTGFKSIQELGEAFQLTNVQTKLPEAGVSFLYTRHRRTMIVAVGACFSIASIPLAVAPEAFGIEAIPTLVLRVVGVIGALFFGFWALATARIKNLQLILTPTGILNEAGLPRSFVPWNAIREITAYTIHVEPLIGIRPTDLSLVEVSSLGRFILRTNRIMGLPEIAYSARGLRYDPSVLLSALLHYHQNPQDRHELATDDGLRRLSQGATGNIA